MLTKREVAGAEKSQARAADAVQEEIPTAAAGAAATVAAVTAAGRPSHASTTDRNEPSDAGTSSDAELRGAPLISPKGTDTTDESAVGSSSAGDSQQSSTPRQVIAVSASKGPAAFFNLARKFLVTDETVDLSALEGAIVSAVDAAHLLERSKLATIVRIHTSYVAVEPRRRRQNPEEGGSETAPAAAASPPIDSMAGYQKAHPISPSADSDAAVAEQHAHQQQQQQPPPRSSRGAPLRRARMIITVKRTEEYKQWLHDNPAYAIFSAGGDDDDVADAN